MKNVPLAVFVIGLIVAAVAMAGPEEKHDKPLIHSIGLIGQGLAVSTSDPSNFEHVRAGIAKIAVNASGKREIIPAGIFFLGGEKFRLRNIAVANKSISADLYSENESVGSLRLELVAKPAGDVWFGSLSANGAGYNLYILGVMRGPKPAELGEDVKELCSSNPEECREFREEKGIGNNCDDLNATNCRDKIKEFCSDHPDDRRCQAVHRVYCMANLDDSRCREMLKNYCMHTERPDRPEVCGRLYEAFKELKEQNTQPEKGNVRERLMEKEKEGKERAMELRERLKERFKVNPETGDVTGENRTEANDGTEENETEADDDSGRGSGIVTQEEGEDR